MPTDPFAGYFEACPITDSNDLGVYADWLDEHEDPRAPAVRAEAAAKLLLPPADVHGVLDAERHLGARFTRGRLAALSTMPWPEELLAACAGTHFLVAGCPLTLLDLQACRPDRFMWGRHRQWYAAEPFGCQSRGAARWHLVRKTLPPDSKDKTFSQQAALLADDERLPNVCEVASAVILHHLVTGERLLEGETVRCADETAHGGRVTLSMITGSGLCVTPEWGEYRSPHVGALPFRWS